MGRQVLIADDELMAKLSVVFRDVGFDAASLSTLADATGLKKASLYHRFPNGKEQMAQEVLSTAANWLSENILLPLQDTSAPEKRVALLVRRLNEFYSGGKQACLLNMLSSAHIHKGPFTKQIRSMFKAFIAALQRVIEDAGYDQKTAHLRAERAVMLLQGSLVLSRGMGTTRPFKEFLKTMRGELLGEIGQV